jgi:hypothetical protein
MTDYCPNCLGKIDVLHSCEDVISEESKKSAKDSWHSNQSLESFIILAPLSGVLIDLFIPLPSSVLHSLLLSILGSSLAAAIWVTINFEGSKSFSYFLKNLKNFIFAPNLIKIFGSKTKSNLTTSWLAVILASTVIQMVIFTPGNSSNLNSRISKEIRGNIGINLSVKCPSVKLYFYNSTIECKVKTGIFGISVPAKAKISPFSGSSKMKVSLT